MRIAVDCRFIGKSGIGTFIENVLNELLTFYPDNDYLLIVESGFEKNVVGENIQIVKTDIQPFSLMELFRFPVKEINKCDVFFTPYINIPGGIKIPIFCTIHDVVFFDIAGLVSPLGKFVRKLFYRRAIQCSKQLFTVSNFSKSRILHHFSTRKRIVVVYNGISPAIRDYVSDENVEKEDYFIYVGNIKKHKGLHTLIEAFSKAKSRGLSTKLMIVGSCDNLRSADSQLYTDIDKVDGVEFTGWVSNDKLMRLISKAKALVQPSLYEGFGIPPLEAICLGTNVLLSDIPVFKELYSDLTDSFFSANDADNLAEKLLSFTPNNHLSEIKKKLLEKYNYRNTTDIIIKTIINN